MFRRDIALFVCAPNLARPQKKDGIAVLFLCVFMFARR